MTLMTLPCFLSLVSLHGILAAPAISSAVSLSRESSPMRTAFDTRSFCPLPVTLGENPYKRENQYAFSVIIPFAASSSTLEEHPTTTVTVTIEKPTTTTLPPVTTTVTQTIPTPVSSSTLPPPTPTPGPGGLESAKVTWVAPTRLDDLTPFNIAHFPGGKNNLQIVNEIPVKANGIPTDGSNVASTKDLDDSPSILQLFFPQGSIDPARKPQGGAEFYATPIDISSARSVSLTYSVFFPPDFDWVLAGKLPGLYGGHTGCSGGNAALDCFSTRLMWRKEGAGELYLYAPKDKQTDALCSDPGSVCDATYGLSIGRGSFTWAAGDWTTVRQTVILNTPGMQDGNFMLDVNGQRVIDRVDVLYRNNLADDSDGNDDDDSDAPTTPPPKKTPTSTRPHVEPRPTSDPAEDDGGLLGSLLGLLHKLGLRDIEHARSAVSIPTTAVPVPTTSESSFQPPTTTISSQHMSNKPQTVPTTFVSLDSESDSSNEQVGFIGIFFSTFFGGHDDKYATPRDQYIWFKDFALAYNS